MAELGLTQGTTGGYLTPSVTEFGIRVNKVSGGYLINKFSEGLTVATTLEETKQIVLDYFEQTLNPKSDEKNEATISDLGEGQVQKA